MIHTPRKDLQKRRRLAINGNGTADISNVLLGGLILLHIDIYL